MANRLHWREVWNIRTLHTSEKLWHEHAPASGYPPGVVPIPTPIAGTSFFPGGYGLWNPTNCTHIPPFPAGEIMVLGHDFHSEAGYHASLRRGYESPQQPTWRNLVALLTQAGIPLKTCFFTNVYMGLRAGTQTIGPFPGARNAAFVLHCRRFLLRQLEVQRPRLILTLGIVAPYVLASLSEGLKDWLGQRHGFRQIDAIGPVQRDIAFCTVPGLHTTVEDLPVGGTGRPDAAATGGLRSVEDVISGGTGRRDAAATGSLYTTVVALTHPCLRHAGVRHRRYKGFAGISAEEAMLEDALEYVDTFANLPSAV